MKKERVVRLNFSGGSEWINVRAADKDSRLGGNVRQQGYHLTEGRWGGSSIPLTLDEQAEGLRLIRELHTMMIKGRTPSEALYRYNRLKEQRL